jgi:hypothetical protein
MERLLDQLKTHQKHLLYAVTGLLFTIFLVIAAHTEGSYGGADSFQHYLFSRYSWKHPHLLLDHWGKPLFTLLSSLFSQFGFYGIQCFNILIGMITAWLTYKVLEHLNVKLAPFAVIFVCFTPLYFVMLFTGLTELTFSLFLVAGIDLVLKKKTVAAAIVISFSPFVRTEGFLLLPVFFVVMLVNRDFRATPFLCTGLVVYSLVGSFHFGDIFWVVQRNPYVGARDIYGHGQFLDYFRKTETILGTPLSIMVAFGVTVTLFRFFKEFGRDKSLVTFTLLGLGSASVYILAHSYVWWWGLAGSLGLERVMAGILPPLVIAAIIGLELSTFIRIRTITVLILLFAMLMVIREPFIQYRIPNRMDPPQKLMNTTVDWLKTRKLTNDKVYYYDPFAVFLLGTDPWDDTLVQERLPDPENPGKSVEKGSLLIWDSHFGPNEGRLPLERVLESGQFALLKRFTPERHFTVLGGYPFEIHVFRKTDS